MSSNASVSCPECGTSASYSRKRGQHFCLECENYFDAEPRAITPQTIFFSYAHKSEREEDFDISEELVLLIKVKLERDGHSVWIDKEGIRGGSQWREKITTAILGHTHFLSFLSRRAVRDPGVCLNEIAITWDTAEVFRPYLSTMSKRLILLWLSAIYNGMISRTGELFAMELKLALMVKTGKSGLRNAAIKHGRRSLIPSMQR
jgi:hypothetical protein